MALTARFQAVPGGSQGRVQLDLCEHRRGAVRRRRSRGNRRHRRRPAGARRPRRPLLRCRPRSTSRRSNTNGLTIEGPVEQFSVRAPAVLPDDLPESLGVSPARRQGAPYADGTCHDRSEARRRWLRRLASERHQRARDRRGRRRGAHGRRLRQLRRGLHRPRADLPRRQRRLLHRRGRRPARASASTDSWVTSRTHRRPTAILGYLWSKQAYGAMLFATAVSDLPIADALDEPRYRPLFVRLAEEMLAEAPVEGEGLRRVRPRRPRGIDRAPRGVQPALGQDALRHLPRPRRAQAKDGGRGDALALRRVERPAHAHAHPGDRGRAAPLRDGRTSSCSPPTPGSRPRARG